MKLPELKDIKKVAHLYPFVIMVRGLDICLAIVGILRREIEWREDSHRLL